jgi:hypothetical protein
MRVRRRSFCEVGLDVVDGCEVLLRLDEVVEAAHVGLLLVGSVGTADPPHPGALAHLKVLELAVDQLLQLLLTFELHLAHVQQIARKQLGVLLGLLLLQLQHLLLENLVGAVDHESRQVGKPLV